jgi:hypothetical protein
MLLLQAILVITDRDGTKNTVTELYRSTDNGLSFTDESAKINRETVNSESLLKNTYFPERVRQSRAGVCVGHLAFRPDPT